MEERLQKILAHRGIASRRAAEEMIRAGRVTVAGQVVREMGLKVDTATTDIAVDGQPLASETALLYFLLNKPKGYVSTVADERGRKTVLTLLPEVQARIYPVGRLDIQTEGLLLLTNDGALTNALLHPRREVRKTYLVRVAREVSLAALRLLRKGVELGDGKTAPAEVRFLGTTDRGFFEYEITIHEGRNRQVRRMFEAVGSDVKFLRRTKFAGLTLAGVPRGAYRALTYDEVQNLRAYASDNKSQGEV